MSRTNLVTMTTVMLVGASVGAAATYLFDPDRGRSRRARLTDQARANVRRDARAVERRARYERGRLEGLAHSAARHHTEPPDTDQALIDKVRSEVLGYMPDLAQHVNVDAVDGVVTLRGELHAESDATRLEDSVRRVEGVNEVVNLIHMPDEPAPNKIDARRITS